MTFETTITIRFHSKFQIIAQIFDSIQNEKNTIRTALEQMISLFYIYSMYGYRTLRSVGRGFVQVRCERWALGLYAATATATKSRRQSVADCRWCRSQTEHSRTVAQTYKHQRNNKHNRNHNNNAEFNWLSPKIF